MEPQILKDILKTKLVVKSQKNYTNATRNVVNKFNSLDLQAIKFKEPDFLARQIRNYSLDVWDKSNVHVVDGPSSGLQKR